jgi:hypothetical protein
MAYHGILSKRSDYKAIVAIVVLALFGPWIGELFSNIIQFI